jgi:outer membrane protein assembly factor BamE (lipoprotein component of BamABCDE complex)
MKSFTRRWFGALFSMLLTFALICFAGCATVGTKLDASAVNQIKKGVSTRQEVEARLGPPNSVMLSPDGKRNAFYMFTERSFDAATYIPMVTYFAGGSKTRTQNLQIVYKDDIVLDYEFNDVLAHTEGGLFNQHGTAVATPTR